MAKAPKKAPHLAAGSRPPRATKAEAEAERYPNLERFPALKRALIVHRELRQGKSREEADAVADQKAGPRAPKWLAKHPAKAATKDDRARRSTPKRGKRPEPEKRVRVKRAFRAPKKSR